MSARLLPEDAAVAIGQVAARLVPWRHRGVLRVSVIVKATFAFMNDAPMPRATPRPLYGTEVRYASQPGSALGGRGLAGSPRYAPDLYPHKERAEIFFTGHAHRLGGPPVEEGQVRIGVFDGADAIFDKLVVVRYKGGSSSVPLTYDRAYGGSSFPDNPIGVGADRGTGEPAIVTPGDDRMRAGFGPVGALWAPRRALLKGASPPRLDGSIVELPDDFDFDYFHAAPEDQRVRSLRGDEWIVMDGVHATLPRIRVRLPGARAFARVYGLVPFGVASGQPLVLTADLLRLDGDDVCAMLTFRAVIPVPAEEALDAMVVAAGVELPNEPIVWLAPESLPSRRPAAIDAATSSGTAPVAASAGRATMPFRAPASIASASPPVPVSISGGTAPLPSLREAPPSTPFRAGPAPDSIARASGASSPRVRLPEGMRTMEYSVARPPPAALPFAWQGPPAAPAPAVQSPPPPPVDAESPAAPANLAQPPVATPPEPPVAIVTPEPAPPEDEPAPPPAPKPPPPVKAPRRVNVGSLLYGTSKKT